MKSERGATMLEAAIVLPFAFLLILGSIGLGHAVYQNIVLSDAVRSAGRTVALAGPSGLGTCQTAVQATLKSDLERFGINVAPVLKMERVRISDIWGLNVQVDAQLNCELCQLFLFTGNNIRFKVESYYPLENQNACV